MARARRRAPRAKKYQKNILRGGEVVGKGRRVGAGPPQYTAESMYARVCVAVIDRSIDRAAASK